MYLPSIKERGCLFLKIPLHDDLMRVLDFLCIFVLSLMFLLDVVELRGFCWICHINVPAIA
jgi:hypothetical protein